MSTIARIYTRAVRRNLKPLFANWEPGRPIELGDFGLLADNSFVYLGKVADLGVQFEMVPDPTKDTKSFSTKGSVEMTAHAGAAATPQQAAVNASLDFKFSAEDAVFFNAAECTYDMIENKVALGDQILKLHARHKWRREWVVVTDLVKAKATTILVSGNSSGSITLTAAGNVGSIDLSDASLKLAPTWKRNVGYEVVTGEGMIPLIGLCKIRPRFLWFGKNFRPRLLDTQTPGMIEAMRASDEVQTEGDAKELYFGQLTGEEDDLL